MKKAICIVMSVICLMSLSACREADRVSYNVGKEADNFNVTRRITVFNIRTDTVLCRTGGKAMSILIKGMEMPTDCPMCKLAHWDRFDNFCGCEITPGKRYFMRRDKAYAESNTRPDWCPLIEVPEPHGRLGDLDKLEQMFIDIDNAPYSGFDGAEPFYSAEDAAQIIRLAPTVLPASGEGETWV